MVKIDFHNATEPAINDTNLNQMQLNIENAINAQVSGDTLPIGSIMPFGSNTVPENWLLCDGQAVSRTEYDLLFSIIGTSYGVGDGSTTFNLPNLKGRVAVGKDSTQTEFDTLGETGGEKTHTQTIDEMATHRHDGIVWADDTHPVSLNNGSISAGYCLNWTGTSDAGGLRTTYTGLGQPMNNLQPYQVTNYIIKAKQSAGVVATVVDSLTSTSTTDALSANQGKILNEKIEELTIYTTTEKVVGTWIDDKPIYRKCFDVGTVSSNVEINTNIINFSTLISATGRGKLENQYWTTLPQTNIHASGVYFAINLNNDGSKIQIKKSSNSFQSVVIIIEYTKTTD